MGTKMQSIYFLALNEGDMLEKLDSVHKELLNEIKTTNLTYVSKDRVKLSTPLCELTFVNMDKQPIHCFQGVRCDIVVIDNKLRFDKDWYNDVLQPLIGASALKQGDSITHHGLMIGWHQFMGEKGLLKYCNCNRMDIDLQNKNTYERISRQDYFRDDVVRFGEWNGIDKNDKATFLDIQEGSIIEITWLDNSKAPFRIALNHDGKYYVRSVATHNGHALSVYFDTLEELVQRITQEKENSLYKDIKVVSK